MDPETPYKALNWQMMIQSMGALLPLSYLFGRQLRPAPDPGPGPDPVLVPTVLAAFYESTEMTSIPGSNPWPNVFGTNGMSIEPLCHYDTIGITLTPGTSNTCNFTLPPIGVWGEDLCYNVIFTWIGHVGNNGTFNAGSLIINDNAHWGITNGVLVRGSDPTHEPEYGTFTAGCASLKDNGLDSAGYANTSMMTINVPDPTSPVTLTPQGTGAVLMPGRSVVPTNPAFYTWSIRVTVHPVAITVQYTP